MIISRSPLRISFVGGGTDLPAFYEFETGACLSATIDKYLYVVLNNKFDGKVRVSYSITENVDVVDRLQHDIIRNAFKMLDVFTEDGVEIATVADVPGKGTGLGSSSALAVALILAMSQRYALKPGQSLRKAEWLARKACELEMVHCQKPIGKQDQYAAAYGGINLLRFNSDGSVEVNRVQAQVRSADRLHARLLLFHLGKHGRNGDNALQHQQNMATKKLHIYRKMAELAETFYDEIVAGNMDGLGELMHNNWEYKKEVAPESSNPEIDEIYARARALGATGGKVLGAGGGGFMLFFAPQNKHHDIATKLKLRRVPFNFDLEGAKIIYRGR
jgi:D-glycero-alpha-D-manno-heptose-7-phosphate kinase